MQDLKRVFTHLGPFKKEFILSILFIIAETGFELTIPLIMADIIDVGVQTRDIHYICMKGVQMGFCALFSLITGLLYARYAARAALGFGSGVREAEFSRIQSYSFANLDHFSTSSLITRMTTDITVMQNAITGALQAEVWAAALHARGHPAYGRSVNTKAMVYLHRGFFHFPRRVAEAAGQHGKEALS